MACLGCRNKNNAKPSGTGSARVLTREGKVVSSSDGKKFKIVRKKNK